MVPQYTVHQFMSHGERHFTAEASELTRSPLRPVFGRIYDDSADEGFILINPTTGQSCRMVVHDVRYNEDNDIVAWDVRPDPRDETKLMKKSCFSPFTLTVYND